MNPTSSPRIQSKHEQVYHLIAERIREGSYSIDGILPSEAEIRRQLEVSRATVRRALSALVKNGQIEPRQGVGYRIRARNARPVVGIIYGNHQLRPDAPSADNQMLCLLTDALKKHQFTTQLFCVRPYEARRDNDRDELIASIRNRLLHGLISVAWPCSFVASRSLAKEDGQLLQLIREFQVPTTGISDMNQPGMFSMDYHRVGLCGTQHFLNAARSRIAVIAGDDSVIDHDEIVAGYRNAMAGSDTLVRNEWIIRTTELSRAAGYAAMRKLFELKDRPEAVVIGDDILACGAMTAVLELGIDVPRKLEIATLYVTGCELLFPKPFVQIQVNLEAITDAAVRRIASGAALSLMDEPAELFQPKIVTVASSTPSRSVGKVLIAGA